VGTDAMNPGVVPGFSVLEELRNLTDIGFTPFEAIQSATRYPAEFLSHAYDFGTVAIGQRADLLLVNGNPLADLANVEARVGVMARGRWLPEAELQKRLNETPETYAQEERMVKSLMERDPARALRYLSDNDPFENLASRLVTAIVVEQGLVKFKQFYSEMKRRRPDAALLQEDAINMLGYRLLQRDRKKEAIEVFTMNTEAYPKSANTYDSLAEAYMVNGDREQAIKFYKKALEIDPKLTSSLDMLKKLTQPQENP
jgi:tetratricopeptide (TPR) repeat protein